MQQAHSTDVDTQMSTPKRLTGTVRSTYKATGEYCTRVCVCLCVCVCVCVFVCVCVMQQVYTEI